MIIAANFKTNHTRKSTKEYISKLNEFLEPRNIEDDIYIFPPCTAFDDYELSSKLNIGVQNAYPVKSGSYTGEIGKEQLDEFGIDTVLIGHSERRHILQEDQKLIAEKYSFFRDFGFSIVYCVGEPKEVREKGIDSVIQYVLAQFENIDINYEKLIVAYEPVWAIGTGLTATKEQISETLDLLREKISSPLLYGGSVKLENTEEILSIKNCDGVLVGTSSWNVESFCEMIETSKKINT